MRKLNKLEWVERIRLLVMASTLAIGLAQSMLATPNLVQDGGFEGYGPPPAFTTYYAGSSIGAWNVTAGSVDVVSAGFWPAPAGIDSLDMSGWLNGRIEQTIDGLTPGEWYYLQFDMAANPDGSIPRIRSLSVSFGNTTMTFTSTHGSFSHYLMNWELRAGLFQADSTSDTLSFTSTDVPSNWFGPVIDEVSLLGGVSGPTYLDSGPKVIFGQIDGNPVPEALTFIHSALALLLPLGLQRFCILRTRKEMA